MYVCNAGDPDSIPGSEDPLEKEMVAHSSILAWKIPWMEEPGGLQPMGSLRIGLLNSRKTQEIIEQVYKVIKIFIATLFTILKSINVL